MEAPRNLRVRPAAEVEGRKLRLDTACGTGALACPKPDGGRFPNTEGRLLHHDAIPFQESSRAIHSATEHGCHQAKDESCKTSRTITSIICRNRKQLAN